MKWEQQDSKENEMQLSGVVGLMWFHIVCDGGESFAAYGRHLHWPGSNSEGSVFYQLVW